MASEHDIQFSRALNDYLKGTSGGPALDRVFRCAYGALHLTRAAAFRTHGRAYVEDATQNALREFLEKLRGGTIIAAQAPGLLRVMFQRRLLDEYRRVARLRFGHDFDAPAQADHSE